ncbi:MAG: DUF4270 family protein [Paludibacteraceae bacterium]|nr:DUF4270 family protein [Paludibacteraceae bacterium]
MSKKISFVGIVLGAMLLAVSCKNDVANTGVSVLDENDAIWVLADTFAIQSNIESGEAIISQADSFLLGEIETDYGLLRASILTQMACPEGYYYPENAVLDSICLFLYYPSWVGDGLSPLAINAYMMDKGTFRYSGKYPTDLNIDDYCTRDKSILTNRRIVAASEKLDSVQNSNGKYIPALRMRVNDDFMDYFWAIKRFDTQEQFNQLFNGILLETSFGSSTVLNISDIALGVYFHFSYDRAGDSVTVSDMKAFYANSEVRTVNQLTYRDKDQWIEQLKADSDYYNYIVAPAGIYTRLSFPMKQMADSIRKNLVMDSIPLLDSMLYIYKTAYVNLAEVKVSVENVYSGTEANKTRNDWLQPSDYMLLIKEGSVDRFFANKELPSDTCALLSQLTQGVDSAGNTIYYYTYDMSDFLFNQLRDSANASQEDPNLDMLLVPVTVTLSSSSTITAVRQQQTISATAIKSAKNGMNLKLVYSGF